MTAAVRYTICPVDPAAHLFAVTVQVADPDPQGQVFSLPAWIPGSYLVRDFAKHLGPIRAERDGELVAVTQLDKQTWQVAAGEGPLRLTYTVYAWDLSVRKAHLDRSHGYFNGTSTFLRVHGADATPCEVVLEPPTDPACTGWRVATALRRTSGPELGFGIFQAADYDELIDHPVEMGTFDHASFEAGGIPHEVAITGRHRADLDRLCRDLQQICEGHLAVMGRPSDLDRYVFQIMVVGEGYGGLEHRASTSLVCGRGDLPLPGQDKIEDGYRTLLALASHEYFHTWNVKRIKPAAFTPFDLSREAPTTLLWAFEGITSYYEPLGLVRVGLIPHEDFFELLGRKLTDVQRRPGRHEQSVAQSSFEAWTKFYQQDENAVNAIVSYYSKGAMVALALDLTLRERTGGRVGLDDLMRELYARFGESGVGVPEDGIQEVATELSGLELHDFFDRALHGVGDALLEELESLLARVGVTLRLRPREGTKDRGGKAGKVAEDRWATRSELGCGLKGTRILWVRAGSPAMRAGLSAGDEIIALEGLKAGADLLDRVAEYAPGTTVTVHAFRRDELNEHRVVLAAPPLDTVYFELDDDPAHVAAREAWLGGRTR